MTEGDAQHFGLVWVEAWNSHDLERILSHYTDDVEVTSPLMETVLGPGNHTGKGKQALRSYWGPALARYRGSNAARAGHRAQPSAAHR